MSTPASRPTVIDIVTGWGSRVTKSVVSDSRRGLADEYITKQPLSVIAVGSRKPSDKPILQYIKND